MVQAAVRGSVNFSEARIHDPRWWQRMRILLRRVEMDIFREHMHTVHRHGLLTLLVPDLKPEIFNEARDSSASAARLLRELLITWEQQDLTPAAKVDDFRQAWIDVWGDPEDPEVKKRIQATVDYLRNE